MDKIGKKTLGRRKIEMKKIAKKSNLQVSFSKRKKSMFRYAAELCVECGADAAILVRSPAGNVFTFGNPSVESVLHRFQTGQRLPLELGKALLTEESRRDCAEEERRLVEFDSKKMCWWEELQELEGMGLEELEEILGALEGLRDEAVRRVVEMQEKPLALELDAAVEHHEINSFSSSSNLFDFSSNNIPVDYGLQYYSGGLNLQQGATQFVDQNSNDFEHRGIIPSSFCDGQSQLAARDVTTNTTNDTRNPAPTPTEELPYNYQAMTFPVDQGFVEASSDPSFYFITNLIDGDQVFDCDDHRLFWNGTLISDTFNFDDFYVE